MGLLDRVAAQASGGGGEDRSSVDNWLANYLMPAVQANAFGYNGHTYPFGLTTTYGGQRIQDVASTLPGYLSALRSSPPAFAAQMLRARVLSQARFKFRNRSTGRLFGTPELGVLEKPWVNGATSDLASVMEWHAGLAGSAYVLRQAKRLRVLRPDWVGLIYGTQMDPQDLAGGLAGHMLDGELLGYVYQPGGIGCSTTKPELLLPADVAHWAPVPDPESPGGGGMSWITPAVREIQGDLAATQHKLQFFANGATPNLVVKGITAANKTQFDEIVDMMEDRHKGLANAYRTLYLAAGADATVVGSDLKQIDFSAVQALGEARITMLSGVPASLIGITKGLEGSTLNGGNAGVARRSFGDTWVKPTLQSLSEALSSIITVPAGSELWFDTTDIALMHEDGKDAADIQFVLAQTIKQLIDAGFTADSAVASAVAQDPSILVHSGLVSVQLQRPGATDPTPPTGGAA